MDAEMKTRTNKQPRVELLQFATKDGDCILLRTTSMRTVPKPLSVSMNPHNHTNNITSFISYFKQIRMEYFRNCFQTMTFGK